MKLTYLVFLLDETGSMMSIKDDTIGGFNEFLDGLDGNVPFEFTLIKWDSNRQEAVCAGVAPKDVPRLTLETYRPGASTPLVDVMYGAIEKTAEKIGERDVQVQVVVQTDGHENASVEHTSDELNALIKEKTEAGWLFTFIGAGIDAFDQAGEFGITPGQTMSYDRDKSHQAFRAMGQSTMRYAQTGDVKAAAFSDAERRASGGHTAPAPAGGSPSVAKQDEKKASLVNVDW